MKRKFRFLLPLIASISLTGCDFITIVDDNNEEDGGTTVVVDQTVIDKFYSSYNFKLSGGLLANELQKMCFEKHTNYVSYGQFNAYCSTTTNRNSIEAVANGSKVNEWFYTGKEASGYGTREHVWPCANSGSLWLHNGSDVDGTNNVDKDWYTGGGSDLLHVRTCNSSVNTARGNAKYMSFDDPEYISEKSSAIEKGESKGKYVLKVDKASYSQKAEPADQMKGDVARIILYVWVHYQDRGITPEGYVTSSGHKIKYTDMTGTLSLTSIMNYDTEARCKEVLKAWNKLDAPSDVEKLRNDTVQKIQGNRNPFVDYPELVDKLLK